MRRPEGMEPVRSLGPDADERFANLPLESPAALLNDSYLGGA
jgi:hypothetical protein